MRVEGAPAFLAADWEPTQRILALRYPQPTRLEDAMADETIAWLDAFWERHGPAMGLLVDAANVRDASYGYRQRFGAWFRRHAPEIRLAIYNVSPFVRVMVILFGKATRLEVRVVRDEKEGIAWLRPLSAR